MIFNKLKNSQKLIKLIKITKDFPFYFADIFILIYSFIYNLLFFQKIYDKNFVIVTGSDKYFANTLLQLLDNLNKKCVLDEYREWLNDGLNKHTILLIREDPII